jgi:hypothetical protein
LRTIDAIFYEDNSVPEAWKTLLPDWLVAVGFKVQKDLLDQLRQAKNADDAVKKVTAYIAEQGLRLVEPIQVSLISGDSYLYHDWMSGLTSGRRGARVPMPAIDGASYAFLEELLTNKARLVFWEDTTANKVASVLPMHRHNLAFVAPVLGLNILLVVELHWGTSFTRFEYQVAHLKPLVRALQVEIADVSEALVQRILKDPNELYRIGAARFEDLVQNRIEAMGFNAQRISKTFAKDGGVDLLFWREDGPFPFLGALQAKYHLSSEKKTGTRDVRDFAGTLAALPVAIGVLVTNTTFTFDARWVGSKLASHVRLRDQQDLRRWISGRFVDAVEWREIPAEIELCPGVRVRIPKGEPRKP